ncbi:hypothetical protein JXB01_03970 [Candidatus Micrarchaeota archaeon]|nr:hypothetical protein [Candidatus Micrarchaeota archaeon]
MQTRQGVKDTKRDLGSNWRAHIKLEKARGNEIAKEIIPLLLEGKFNQADRHFKENGISGNEIKNIAIEAKNQCTEMGMPKMAGNIEKRYLNGRKKGKGR